MNSVSRGRIIKIQGIKISGMAIRADTAWRLWWKLSRLQEAGQQEAAMERAKMNSKTISDEQGQSTHTLAAQVFKITWRLVLSFYFQVTHNVYKLIMIKFEGCACVETHKVFFFLRQVLFSPHWLQPHYVAKGDLELLFLLSLPNFIAGLKFTV